ncbi:hypothetical protein [Pandoravirus japonicus]|uniref:Uncharacterized protein n=1 Tax=Pandoravirus japonicus TaxID=2823154 RepID=A0A811BSH5_9VIRU|nr:hypothetical protein [Pandoravirus japonicus]
MRARARRRQNGSKERDQKSCAQSLFFLIFGYVFGPEKWQRRHNKRRKRSKQKKKERRRGRASARSAQKGKSQTPSAE